jgi:hypothetical protein
VRFRATVLLGVTLVLTALRVALLIRLAAIDLGLAGIRARVLPGVSLILALP